MPRSSQATRRYGGRDPPFGPERLRSWSVRPQRGSVRGPAGSLKDQPANVGVWQLPLAKKRVTDDEVPALQAAQNGLVDGVLGETAVEGMVKSSIQTTAENVIARNLG